MWKQNKSSDLSALKHLPLTYALENGTMDAPQDAVAPVPLLGHFPLSSNASANQTFARNWKAYVNRLRTMQEFLWQFLINMRAHKHTHTRIHLHTSWSAASGRSRDSIRYTHSLYAGFGLFVCMLVYVCVCAIFYALHGNSKTPTSSRATTTTTTTTTRAKQSAAQQQQQQ